MFILEVIPIARGAGKETLTYFAGQQVPLGFIVSIPLRKKTVPALVVSVTPAREGKASLRSSSFQLKKIVQSLGPTPLSRAFITTCSLAKDYLVTTTGKLLALLVSKKILETTVEQVPRVSVKVLHIVPTKNLKQSFMVKDTDHVVITPQELYTTFTGLQEIIIEYPFSSQYKTRGKTPLDVRICAELFAQVYGIPFSYGTTSLETKNLYVIDARKEYASSNDQFTAIGSVLQEKITQAVAKKEKIFLFVLRKGFAGTTICRDCHTTIHCAHCGLPLVLSHQGSEGSTFVCYRCNHTRQPEDRCPVCQGHRFSILGIGIERVVEELRILFPEMKLFICDADTTKTAKQVKETITSFTADPQSILIGTELALNNIPRNHVDTSIIVSLDSLFSVPQWNITDKIIDLLARIQEITRDTTVLTTRHTEHALVKALTTHSLEKFHDQERILRDTFKYPPTYVLIKIQSTSPLDTLMPILKKWQPALFGSSILIRIITTTWPDHELISKLRSLGNTYTITVNPDSLL